MKTFDEIINNVEQDELNEGRLIRKGTAILFAKNAPGLVGHPSPPAAGLAGLTLAGETGLDVASLPSPWVLLD